MGRDHVRRLTDIRIYEQELVEWLPEHILDCHVHMGLRSHVGQLSAERLRNDWALRLGLDQTWNQLRDNYRLLFPGRSVQALAFGNVFQEADTEQTNAYVHAGIGREDVCAGALYVTRPEYSAEKVAQALAEGFIGLKPYPDLAPQGPDECHIPDFLPRHQLEVLNEVGGILMLHLPGPKRLADEHSIRDLIDMSGAYPNVAIIVAHVGRAYCLPTALQGLPHLAPYESISFDITANLNHEVLSLALQTVGPERLLFGSDLPITMVRGSREHAGNNFINHLETNETEMGIAPLEDGGYTFLLYEELRALIRAVKDCGLGRETMHQILYSNCAHLLDRCSSRTTPLETTESVAQSATHQHSYTL